MIKIALLAILSPLSYTGKVFYSERVSTQELFFDLNHGRCMLKTAILIDGGFFHIILISGDSDFVPAAKTARREGIDFIFDPMWNHIDDELHLHIDGLQSKQTTVDINTPAWAALSRRPMLTT